MNSLTIYIIIAITGMIVVVPVLASDSLKAGDYVSTEGMTEIYMIAKGVKEQK